MAVARTYNVDSGSTTGITVGSTTPGSEFVLMFGQTVQEFNISAIRVGTYSGSSASYPSNGTITWRLRRVRRLQTGLQGGTGNASPVGQSTTAAQSTWYYSTLDERYGRRSLPTGPSFWEQTIPCTAGANWGEWFTPGFESTSDPGRAPSRSPTSTVPPAPALR